LAIVVWHWQYFGSIGNSLSENFNRVGQPFYEIFKILLYSPSSGLVNAEAQNDAKVSLLEEN